MKEQGMYSAFTGSLFFHVLLLIVTGIVARHTSIYRMPSPYIVSLVDTSGAPGPAAGPRAKTAEVETAPQPAAKTETRAVQNQNPAIEKPTRQDTQRVSDRISALLAKKRIERLAALRKVIDIGNHKAAPAGASSSAAARPGRHGTGGTSSGSGGDYYSAIVGRIRQQWVYPDSLDKDLEATVSIRIAKDGSVTIQGIERSSGNRLFDRSVLSAINKASPLPPPPQEIEIGVRFRP